MSHCQIWFRYNQEDVIIQSERNELMNNIIERYGKTSNLPIDKFFFLYNDNEINPDLTLSQLNNEDEEVLIFVYPKNIAENENKIKETNYIKCSQSDDPAILEFSNNYELIFSNNKNGTEKIKLQDFNNTQKIDQTEIKCSKCSKSKTETYKEKFFYCFECNKNFCPICRSLHKEHENIVDYSNKYSKCSEHKDQNFISYCFDCKKNLCILCESQHNEHNIINFTNLKLKPEQSKNFIEKIQKVKKLVDNIIESLQQFEKNINVYEQIYNKLNENILNMNFNYENLKNMINLIETSFLETDINQILNSSDINKKFQKIMTMYDIMKGKVTNIDDDNFNEPFAETQIKKCSENSNEIELKVKIEQSDVGKNIYFLDNTNENDFSTFGVFGGGYHENGKRVIHNHDNLREIDESNTTLIINEKTVPFKKFFIPTKSETYSIKLQFKIKLSSCAYMFCYCKNIIEIDFSKFNTENVTDMYCMFRGCSGLKSLNLESFNTEKVTNLSTMFSGCSPLTSLDLRSFNTEKVTDMSGMFGGCFSLESVNLRSFNTQEVTDMVYMFSGCTSLTTLDLSSFNASKADTGAMFYGSQNLMCCGSSDKNIVDAFNQK